MPIKKETGGHPNIFSQFRKAFFDPEVAANLRLVDDLNNRSVFEDGSVNNYNLQDVKNVRELVGELQKNTGPFLLLARDFHSSKCVRDLLTRRSERPIETTNSNSVNGEGDILILCYRKL